MPSLGEDRVVLATPADLGPAVAVSKVDPPAAAAVKGDLRMVDVLARAVRAHERAPRAGIELWAGRFRLVVEHDRPRGHRRDGQATVDDPQRRPAAGGAPPPAGAGAAYRNGLERDHRLGRIGPEAVRYAPSLLDVVDGGALAQALHGMWPLLSPEGLVRRLLASPRRLASAGRDILTDDELDALHASREGDDGWSEADVALLDEADLLLGLVPRRLRRRRAPTAARPRGRADPGRAAARVPAVRAPTRVPAGRGVRRDRLDCRECKATYATTTLMGDPPPTSCTACTRSSPTSSTSGT